jgi:class 3 adenylate cyclase/tetratricopeptide (TPR) repeat protein
MPQPEASTVTLLFTDLANSAELLQRAGDERAQRIFQAHHRLLKRFVAAHGGREARWLGDGWIAVFASPADAVHCAVAMQLAARRRAADARLAIRVGLHIGETLRDETDYFGTAVVIARCLCGSGQAAQVVCSAQVCTQLADPHGFTFRDSGALAVAGLTEPVPSAEVMYQQDQPLALLTHTPFVGRAAELARLAARLQEVRVGSGGVLLLAGEPGIGKTRTLEECAETARTQGALVLWGRCYEGEAARPYGPFVEALSEYAHGADPDALCADLGLGAAPLARLVPALRERLPDIPEPVALQPDEERVRLLDACAQFLIALAARAPLVLVLDDLHWADAASVALLRHVARFAARHPLLLLGAYRDVDVTPQHPLADALGALPRETRCEHVALTGLGNNEVEELLEAVAYQKVPDAVVTGLTAETNGNPFFIREILLHLAEEGKIIRREGRWISSLTVDQLGIPHGVRHVILRRLGRLSESAKRLLSAAAGFSGSFRFDLAARVAALDEAAALDAIDEALAAQLLCTTGASDSFDFSHALVRHTLYAELSPPRQVRLHRQIAEAMEQVYGDPSASSGEAPSRCSGQAGAVERAGEIVRHYHQSASLPGAERGVPYGLAAAAQAESSAAFAETADYLRIVLDLLSEGDVRRPRLLCQLGVTLAFAQDAERALAVVREAAPLIEQTEGRVAAAEYLAGLLDPLFEGGFYPAAFEVARMGLGYVGDRRDTLWAPFAAIATIEREFADAESRITIDSPEREEIGELLTQLAPVPPGYAQTFIRRDRRPTVWDVGAGVFWRGEYRSSLPLLYEQAASHTKLGLIVSALNWWTVIARCHIALGDFALAHEALARATRLVERIPGPSARKSLLVHTEEQLRAALDEGWDQQMGVPGVPRPQRLPRDRAATDAAIARIHARMRRTEPALRRLSMAIPAIERAPGWADGYTRVVFDAAETLWLTERTDHIEIIEHNLRTKVIAPDFRYPMTDGRLALARLCALRGSYDEASEWFSKARVVLDEQGARPLRAIVDYDEALMFVRRGAAGDHERAEPLLTAALQQFHALGMPGWIQRADELRAPRVAAALDTVARQDGTGETSGSVVRTAPEVSATSIHASDVAVQHHEGDYWTLTYDGATGRLKDTNGLHYLAHLVCHPGQAFHVLNLMNDGCQGVSRGGGHENGAPLLDVRAKAEYRQRLKDLRAELEEAEQFNDGGRTERLRAEIEAITEQLAAAVGLGGRDRHAASAAERARSTVTQRIRAAIKKIHQRSPSLADRLARRVKTGTFCVYEPDPAHPIVWQLDQ